MLVFRTLTFAFLLTMVATPLFSQMVIKGKAYADYYYNVQNNNSDFEGLNGFWFRRVRLTVDNKISDILSTRFRIEMATNGDFTTNGTIDPYLKDAYVNIKAPIIGKDLFRIGIMETIGKKTVEKLWGYRGFEKTPTDFYKYRSSRDFGLLFTGKRGIFDYSLMIGNESSNKMEVNTKKMFYGNIGVKPIDGLYIQTYYDRTINDDYESAMAQLFVAYELKKYGRLGVLFSNINQNSGETIEDSLTTVDQSNNILSIYAVAYLHNDLDLILRFDWLSDELINPTKMAYTPLTSTKGRTTGIFAGLSYKGIKNLFIMPYIGYFAYEEEGLDADIYTRLTFEFRY